MAPSSTPAAPADSYKSVAEILADHTKLLGELPEEPGLGDRERVVEFVRKAAGAGAVLDSPDDRRQAQGLIDYWAASLWQPTSLAMAAATKAQGPIDSAPATQFTGARGAGGGSGRGKNPGTVLAPFNPATLTEAMDSATRWIGTLSEDDQALVRRVLLRLVRLGDDGTAVAVPLSRFALNDLERPRVDEIPEDVDSTRRPRLPPPPPRPRVDEILDELAARGVIRLTTRSDGSKEISLRSAKFIDDWDYLKELLARRHRFRELAVAWSQNHKTGSSRRSHVGRFVRKQLMSIGKRIDKLWDWVIGLFTRRVLMKPDPTADLPDVDYYRDRTPAEIDYLFYQRVQARQNAEWVRLIKGLSVVGIIVLVGVVTAVWVRGDNAVEKEKRLKSEAVAAAKDNELTLRRARQRLKELIGMLRLHTRHYWYQYSPEDKLRADFAMRRAEAQLQVMEEKDLDLFLGELDQIGIRYDKQTQRILSEQSDPPLDVARKLRELILSRCDPKSPSYDHDTVTYYDSLRRLSYRTSQRVVEELTSLLTSGKVNGQSHNYSDAVRYMDEFWVLYYGEMAVVESDAVRKAMIDFGDRLKEIDALFYPQFKSMLEAVPGARKGDPKRQLPPETSTLVKGEYWTVDGEEGRAKLYNIQRTFEKQSVEMLRNKSEKAALDRAANALKSAEKKLSNDLDAELNSKQ
jgi:hypothetical protein